jgi:DNA-binding transcriptional LysR family regulator
LPTSGDLYAWEFERDGRSVNVRVDGPFVLNDQRLLIDAALHGAGLAIVMEDMVAAFIADGRLVRVLEDWSPPFSGYHLYYPNRRHPSPAFAALLEELRANSSVSRANDDIHI